jgi:hypothetical protein
MKKVKKYEVVFEGRTIQVEGHRLDPNLRQFLRRECILYCQSLGIAAWATTILRQKWMTMRDLERCFVLGFNP